MSKFLEILNFHPYKLIFCGARCLVFVLTFIYLPTWCTPGRLAQSVTCLTADPGVASWILARSHTFAEIDHEITSTAIVLTSADSRRVVVNYKRKYVCEGLVNCLVKLAHEKSVFGELTVPT